MAYPNNKKQYGGGRPGGTGQWVPLKLPDGYEEDLRGGYFYQPEGAEKPVMKPKFILGYPEKIADALALEGGKKKNKSSQIRRYYDFCIRVRDLLSSGRSYEEMEATFCRLVPLVEYAKNRDLVTSLFVDFINRNIDAIYTVEDFTAFVMHFEAVVAHMKQEQGRGT